MSVLVAYDNTIRPNEIIGEIIGQKGFGDVIVKRKLLKKHYNESISKAFQGRCFEWVELDSIYDFETLMQQAQRAGEHGYSGIVHCFSSFYISDPASVALTLKKVEYITEIVGVECGEDACAVMMFPNADLYIDYLKKSIEHHSSERAMREYRGQKIMASGFVNIGSIRNFIQCVTGDYSSRYFNSMEESEYTLRKSSTDKVKIKSEYQYYHLLPENMQRWFVMPFDYRETDTTASYAMERLYMTDLAIKWVHGSVGIQEFKQILDIYFTFFRERKQKEVSKEEYKAINTELYVTKVKNRIDALKQLPAFSRIAHLLATNERYNSIDEVFDWYLDIKNQVEREVDFPCISVIGHGDPCFANAMYNYSSRMLKFIDPKGALTEQQLYTNPYYDIAKLSHSICGNYDFFNNAMFDIALNERFEYLLTIPFDNTEYKKLLRKKMEENGYDYWAVRVYEASLFLSMLPLHIDYPHKVFGFLLNAMSILKEIEESV